MLLRLLGVAEPVPDGHVEIDVSTLPRDVRERGRGVAQATTDKLPLLRCLKRYVGVHSVEGSAERRRRIELNLLWQALDRGGIYAPLASPAYPHVSPWSLDHPDLWDGGVSFDQVEEGELLNAIRTLLERGELKQSPAGWACAPAFITTKGKKRIAAAGGQVLLDVCAAVPRNEKGKALPHIAPRGWTDEQERALKAAWRVFNDRKRETAMRLRAELEWVAPEDREWAAEMRAIRAGGQAL